MKLIRTSGHRAVTAGATAAFLAVAGSPGAAQAATTWTVTHPPFAVTDTVPYVPLNAIAADSASDAWAVGEDSGQMLAEHWNGASWSRSTVSSRPCRVFESQCVLTGVGTGSARDAIAVGDGIINSESPAGWVSEALAFRWNGSKWRPMPLPADMSPGAMKHVQVFSPDDAWAVGTASTSTAQLATAEHWNGTSWIQVPTPVSSSAALSINAISGTSGHDIWVVGETETGGYDSRKFTSVLMHYDGSQWTQRSVPDQSGLLDVSADSPGDAWAIAADGGVLHWNGTSWRLATRLTAAAGGAVVCALSPADVWVATVGSLAHYNGSAWATTPLPAGIDGLTGHAAISPSDAWISGYYYPPSGDTDPAVLSTITG